jgi:hypothetical protein
MSLKSDWNYVKRAMQTPCNNGSVGIYIETGIATAGIAALDILTFGCREIVKHSIGRGQVKEWFGTESRRINNPMSHRRPRTGGKFRAPTSGSGFSFFWNFEALFERTLYLIMLTEIGKDAALNWTSLMMAANGCDGAYDGYCEFDIKPQIVAFGPDDLLIAPTPGCHGIINDTRAIYIPLGITPDVGYSVNAEPWAPANTPNATLNTYLYDNETDEAWAAAEQGSPGSGGNGVAAFQKNLPGRTASFRKISVRALSSGYSWIPGGKLQVTLKGREVKIFTPPDCFKNVVDSAFDKYLQSLF